MQEKIWVEDKEYADGTGRSLWVKTFDLFASFTYFPAENRAWYHSGISDEQSVRFKCASWDEANKLYEQLREEYDR